MTDLNFRALCAELQEAVQLYAGLDPAAADTPVNQRVARLIDALANTTAALAQPKPVWTEGICGDGAAILKDGVMQPIEVVIAALNATALAPEAAPVATDAELQGLFKDQPMTWGQALRAAYNLGRQHGKVPV